MTSKFDEKRDEKAQPEFESKQLDLFDDMSHPRIEDESLDLSDGATQPGTDDGSLDLSSEATQTGTELAPQLDTEESPDISSLAQAIHTQIRSALEANKPANLDDLRIGIPHEVMQGALLAQSDQGTSHMIDIMPMGKKFGASNSTVIQSIQYMMSLYEKYFDNTHSDFINIIFLGNTTDGFTLLRHAVKYNDVKLAKLVYGWYTKAKLVKKQAFSDRVLLSRADDGTTLMIQAVGTSNNQLIGLAHSWYNAVNLLTSNEVFRRIPV